MVDPGMICRYPPEGVAGTVAGVTACSSSAAVASLRHPADDGDASVRQRASWATGRAVEHMAVNVPGKDLLSEDAREILSEVLANCAEEIQETALGRPVDGSPGVSPDEMGTSLYRVADDPDAAATAACAVRDRAGRGGGRGGSRACRSAGPAVAADDRGGQHRCVSPSLQAQPVTLEGREGQGWTVRLANAAYIVWECPDGHVLSVRPTTPEGSPVPRTPRGLCLS